jgi:hypothetical protein
MGYASHFSLTNVHQGVPPATVAEFTLTGDGNRDFYDGPQPAK